MNTHSNTDPLQDYWKKLQTIDNDMFLRIVNGNFEDDRAICPKCQTELRQSEGYATETKVLAEFQLEI